MSHHNPEHRGVEPVPHDWCRRYTPGHRVHWIQWKLAHRTPGLRYTLQGIDDSGELVTVRHDETGTDEVWRLHDGRRLVAAAVVAATSTIQLHDHGMATVTRSDGRSCFYPCRDPERWSDCTPEEVGGIGGIRLG